VSSMDAHDNDYVDVETRLVDPDPSITLSGASNLER